MWHCWSSDFFILRLTTIILHLPAIFVLRNKCLEDLERHKILPLTLCVFRVFNVHFSWSLHLSWLLKSCIGQYLSCLLPASGFLFTAATTANVPAAAAACCKNWRYCVQCFLFTLPAIKQDFVTKTKSRTDIGLKIFVINISTRSWNVSITSHWWNHIADHKQEFSSNMTLLTCFATTDMMCYNNCYWKMEPKDTVICHRGDKLLFFFVNNWSSFIAHFVVM